MFDFDASKLLIIGIVALVFIPSKDLPRVLRQIGQFVGKMRRMAGEFQGQFMDAMREADMAELRREAEALSKAADVKGVFDPIQDVTTHLSGALEGKPALGAQEAATLGAASETVPDAHVGAPADLVTSDLVTEGNADASFADLSHPPLIVAGPSPDPDSEPVRTPDRLPDHASAPPVQADHETDRVVEHPGTLEPVPRSA